jgi:serine/threonine-protein kinase
MDGNAALEAKDYDRALELYQRVYDLTRHPLMLFNIAQAHRLAGRADAALTFYEHYLKEDPNGSEAAGARVRVEELKAAGATVRPELLKPAGTGASPAVEQDVPAPVGATPAAMPALQPGGPDRTDTVGRPGQSLRLTGIALGGVGLASVAVGGYFGLKMRGIRSDAEADVEGGARQEELEVRYLEDGNNAARMANIGFAVGGGLIVGGAVTYWLGYRKDRAAEATAWAPVVGPGFTGIALSGSLP